MTLAPTETGQAPDARAVALDLTGAVLDRGTPLDQALIQSAAMMRLSARDHAFARLLVSTVLRRLGQIDGALAEKLSRPLPKRQTVVRNALRLGIAQLAFLGTPPHAAVDASVSLVRSRGRAGMTGLVNGVLRSIDRDGAEALANTQANVSLNAPDWLRHSWQTAYGEGATEAIMATHLEDPPLDLSLTPGTDQDDWAQRLDAQIVSTGSLRRRGGGIVSELAGFSDGVWWVQDTAAALPAKLFGDVSGQSVIDLCAAPGGKTAQLAAAGARVTAVDISADRLKLVGENLDRLGLQADTVCADATKFTPEEPALAILLDAPCSSTGTIRRHPDIAWLKTPSDVTAAAALQSRLLDAAIGMLTPGGVLIYAVCSLQPEEGPEQIERLLAARDDISLAPVKSGELPGFDGLSPPPLMPDGTVRTLPCHLGSDGGMDGFYIARLRRK